MALKCVECGKTTKNLLQLYCECGGYIEVTKRTRKRNRRTSLSCAPHNFSQKIKKEEGLIKDEM